MERGARQRARWRFGAVQPQAHIKGRDPCAFPQLTAFPAPSPRSPRPQRQTQAAGRDKRHPASVPGGCPHVGAPVLGAPLDA